MRVKVDTDACVGAAACENICPEVFKLVDGIAVVQKDPVPPELEEQVQEAVGACPVSAISIVEE